MSISPLLKLGRTDWNGLLTLDQRRRLAQVLRKLLADEMVTHLLLRYVRWNAVGRDSEVLSQLCVGEQVSVCRCMDYCAARLRTLGFISPYTLHQLQFLATEVTPEEPLAGTLAHQHRELIQDARLVWQVASDEGDPVTQRLAVAALELFEKWHGRWQTQLISD